MIKYLLTELGRTGLENIWLWSDIRKDLAMLRQPVRFFLCQLIVRRYVTYRYVSCVTLR